MLQYKKFENKIPGSTTKGKWYGKAFSSELINTKKLAKHMAEHNTPFSPGAIHDVLIDMINCIKHLVLEGKNVKLDGLAIFYLSVGSKPADKAEDFTAANINSVKLAARATGDMSEKNLLTEYEIKEVDDYQSPGAAKKDDNTKPADNTKTGADTNTGDNPKTGE